jgi:hypothetical protein
MAENLWSSNPWVKVLSEVNAPLCEVWKQSAAQYIDTSEKWAKKALELGEKATAWAKDTPFAPVIELQQSLSRQMVDASASLARRLWQVEGQAEEKAAS